MLRVGIVYDSGEGVIKITSLSRRRATVRLGRRISVEELEEVVEKALDEVTR